MNQITIDGKTYNLVPVEEETEEMIERLMPTGWEKVSYGNRYAYIDSEFNIAECVEYCDIGDTDSYNVGNYFSDKQLAKDMARATSLWLKLHRFAAENQKEKIDWNNETAYKYHIYFEHRDGMIKTDAYRHTEEVTPQFDSEETAEKAIEEFKDELLWYFTEFKNTRRFEQ